MKKYIILTLLAFVALAGSAQKKSNVKNTRINHAENVYIGVKRPAVKDTAAHSVKDTLFIFKVNKEQLNDLFGGLQAAAELLPMSPDISARQASESQRRIIILGKAIAAQIPVPKPDTARKKQ